MSAKNDRPKEVAYISGRRVPLVGDQKAVVRQALISVIATCQCGSNVPIVLANIAARVKCEACGDEYFVRRLRAEFDGEMGGGLEIDLGRLAKAPGSIATN